MLVSPSRRLVGAGLIGNAGVVAAWALSRTAGLPLGPDAWTPEPVTLLDGAATAFEVAIVAACAVLLVSRARRFAFIAAVAAAALTAVPIAVAGGGDSHHHAHDNEAAAHAAQPTRLFGTPRRPCGLSNAHALRSGRRLVERRATIGTTTRPTSTRSRRRKRGLQPSS